MPRKPKISRDAVLHAALQLVDSEGVDALSMRKLGKALDVEAMSLYRYVSNKEAVLDGVYKAVLDKIELPERTGDWVEDMKSLSCAFREALCQHPKALPLFVTRPAVAEGSLDYIEMGMNILEEPFPSPAQRLYAFQSLLTFVVGHTLFQYREDEAEHASALYGKMETLSQESFPSLFSVAASDSQCDSDEEFLFGLETLILGLKHKSQRAVQ